MAKAYLGGAESSTALAAFVSTLATIVAIYLVRTALMNCTYAIQTSILMDFCPKKERARLAFLEEKRQLAAKLSALGIDVDEDLGGEESNHDRPVEYARECKNKQIRNERNILECYRASWRALCSVHGLQVQSGANRITVGFQGLDVFELLPEPPENPACVIPKSEEEKREEEELMKRSTKAREGKSGGND